MQCNEEKIDRPLSKFLSKTGPRISGLVEPLGLRLSDLTLSPRWRQQQEAYNCRISVYEVAGRQPIVFYDQNKGILKIVSLACGFP